MTENIFEFIVEMVIFIVFACVLTFILVQAIGNIGYVVIIIFVPLLIAYGVAKWRKK